jgi:hypothetical protein
MGMGTILMSFVGILCLLLGVRVIYAEERNTVFNKRSIVVKDIKKYNHICGGLIIGFGVAAEITIYFMLQTEGLVSTLLTLAIIVEAVLLSLIYQKIEKHCLK